jgi:3-methyladenine DNA glycosylase/8-oxoguanine DNA glycosylase
MAERATHVSAAPRPDVRLSALRLLQGDVLGKAASAGGYASGAVFSRDLLQDLHVTPEALRRWGTARGYRIAYGGPFHLEQTLGYLGRDPANLAERVEGRRYLRHFPLGDWSKDGVAVGLELGPTFCTVEARRPRSAAQALALHEGLVRFLGLAQPLAAFYRLAGKHRVMGDLVRRYPGVRIPQLPSLWEALCWAVIGQQINLAFAYRLRNRLIALAHGVAAPAPYTVPIPAVPYPFPTPAQVLQLSPEDLLGQQYSRQKARYILGLAEACLSGDLAGMEQSPEHRAGQWDTIEERLLAQTGLGPWSAAYAMMRGLGYLDGLPVGDSGLRTALQRTFRLKNPPTVAQQERLMEPFRPYRSLATYYLWKSLAKTSTD